MITYFAFVILGLVASLLCSRWGPLELTIVVAFLAALLTLNWSVLLVFMFIIAVIFIIGTRRNKNNIKNYRKLFAQFNLMYINEYPLKCTQCNLMLDYNYIYEDNRYCFECALDLKPIKALITSDQQSLIKERINAEVKHFTEVRHKCNSCKNEVYNVSLGNLSAIVCIKCLFLPYDALTIKRVVKTKHF